nr:HD domain-containing protein [uncultured Desulfobulbus sp.]
MRESLEERYPVPAGGNSLVWSQDRYIKAWNFACNAHQGQLLPGSNLAYVNHLGLVAMEVMAAIAQQERIASPDLLVGCALLHDTIEDTSVSYDELLREFGVEIAQGVAALSKNPEVGEKRAQMEESLQRIQQQPPEVWMVKLADRITNLQPPPAHWQLKQMQSYREEAILIARTLGAANPYLCNRLWEKIDLYKFFMNETRS